MSEWSVYSISDPPVSQMDQFRSTSEHVDATDRNSRSNVVAR